MKQGKIILLVIMALMLTTLVPAADLSYSNVTVGYVDAEIDDLDGDGFDIALNANISDSIFAILSYQDIESDKVLGVEVGLNEFRLGVGWHTAITGSMDFVAMLGYSFAELDASIGVLSASIDGDGFVGSTGVRAKISGKIEVGAYATYSAVDFDHSVGEIDGLGFLVDARYFLTDTISTGVSYETVPLELIGEDLDIDEITVSLRFDF